MEYCTVSPRHMSEAVMLLDLGQVGVLDDNDFGLFLALHRLSDVTMIGEVFNILMILSLSTT